MNTAIILTVFIWTLIVAGFGFVIGQHFSDKSNRQQSASQELRDKVSKLSYDAFLLDHQLKKVLDILNDIRTRIPTVSKGLEKPAP